MKGGGLRATWVERAAVRPLVTVRPWDTFDAVSIDIFLGGRRTLRLSNPSAERHRGSYNHYSASPLPLTSNVATARSPSQRSARSHDHPLSSFSVKYDE